MVASPGSVGMAETEISNGVEPLVCLGLGSCIGLVAHDPVAGLSGMAHIMLPAAFPHKPVDKPSKFADTAVPDLIQRLLEQGANRTHLLFAYAGGAQVFKFGSQTGSLDVGIRNAEATARALKRHAAKIVASEVGGHSGRTMTFDPATGEVRIRTAQSGERVLCVLRLRARSA